jgi:hypothetical protein
MPAASRNFMTDADKSKSSPTARAAEIPAPAAGAPSCAFATPERELSGGEPATTNNRMELMAAISASGSAEAPVPRRLYTDSTYVKRRHHQVDPRLEEERLEDGRQEAGEERRTCGSASTAARAAQGRVALGEGPCGHPRTNAPTRWPRAAIATIRTQRQ